MRVVTAAQMVEAEQRTIAAGVPAVALMESAGRHVADIAFAMLEHGGPVAIVCGVGNNAGDGFVAARYLTNRGVPVTLILTRYLESLSPYLRALATPLIELQIPIVLLDGTQESIDRCRQVLGESELVVDALLGTGAQGAPRGAVRLAVECIAATKAKVLAVDLPTGVDADTGRVYGPTVTADTTVVMCAPKLGHLLPPGRERCGRLMVVDVGVPQAYVDALSTCEWIRPEDVGTWFPPRPEGSHKGTFGRVMVIAGSRNMPGAATLAVQGALRSGAGVCSWAGPASIMPIVAVRSPEATVYPLAEEDGAVSPEAVEYALRLAEGRAVALGPGMGVGATQGRFIHQLLAQVHSPLVVDADALTHLAQVGSWSEPPLAPRVLTPHPKEMARLLGEPVDAVLADRARAAREAAQRYQAVVVLKGMPTLVARPDGALRMCPVGNPVLSVGGSGDVLTGVIAGLLAQGLDGFTAATLGVAWHGEAADLLAADGEDASHTAGDLLERIPSARARLMRRR